MGGWSIFETRSVQLLHKLLGESVIPADLLRPCRHFYIVRQDNIFDKNPFQHQRIRLQTFLNIYISFFQTLHYMVGLGTLYGKLHVFMMGMERKNSEKTTGNGKKRKEHFPKLSVKS